MTKTFKDTLPLLPLRDIVIFPHMVVPLLVGRPRSINALDEAIRTDQFILLSTQKNFKVDEPEPDDIYLVGTVSRISQQIKLPDGSLKILAEGVARVRINKILNEAKFFMAQVEELTQVLKKTVEVEAVMRSAVNAFEEYMKLNPRVPPDIMPTLISIEDPDELADSIASYIMLRIPEKQLLLEIADPVKRLKDLGRILNKETDILKVEKKIMKDVRLGIEKSQKDFYLQEQMKAIEKELGEKAECLSEVKGLKSKIFKMKMTKEAQEAALRELEKLAKMMPYSPEGTVSRNYIDWLVALPWSSETKDNLNIENAEKILNEDHYGLEKPKERILEYLAVRKLSKSMKGPVVCFVGPPGVGKTSLAKSIGRALGRNFVRVSLGGIRDEAEIRGHRRTYIGSLPGRIIQSLRKAKSKNPVFLLDEVDKMSVDFRGDPSSALLEVLDPEQNHAFSDHYLEVDFDLSDCLFITTSNVEYNIPGPLRDRMEIIRLPGYTEYEKVKIAQQFLVPKQIRLNGLAESEIVIRPRALTGIIKRYTREAGVRELERKIAQICRKAARRAVKNNSGKISAEIKDSSLCKYLGPPAYSETRKEASDEIGVATGLAWTEVGGDIMNVEATLVDGKGTLTLTGKLGDVMRESAHAALTYIRSRAGKLGIKNGFYKKKDIHIHVPEGAIPKDGPSAGVTIATALASSLIRRPTRNDVAMTGEITLRGRVLAVGGLKSKILAAHRAGIKTVIIPKENENDLTEIPKDIKKELNLKLVGNMDEVLNIALIKENLKRRKNEAAVNDSRAYAGSGRNYERNGEAYYSSQDA